MLTSVRPSVKDGQTRVAMTLLARRAEDVDELMEKLEATGAFDQVTPSATDRTEAGLYRVLVESVYAPPANEHPRPPWRRPPARRPYPRRRSGQEGGDDARRTHPP